MKSNVLLWIVKQIKNRLPAIAVMTAAQAGHSLMCVWFALGARNVIDSAVAGDNARFKAACLNQLGIIAGIILCLTLFRHLKDRLNADLERDWKQRLLHGLLHGEYASVSGYHSGELLNRMNNDVAKVNDGFLSVFPGGAAMITRLSGAILVLGTLDGSFTIWILGLGIVVVAATGFMRRRLKELNKQVSTHDGRVSGFLQESMEKLLMIQAMDVGEEVENRADRLLDERYAIQRKRKNVSLAANSGVSLFAYGISFLALVWCSNRLLRGQMSFGSLTAVIQLVSQLQSPFVNLSGVMPKYIAMVASAERLMELDAIQGEPETMLEIPEEMLADSASIRAEGLCFSYDREQILEDVSFAVPAGGFTVVTGTSGTGKSTLLKLLLGVFRPDAGELYLQTGTRRFPLDRKTRRLFAYVPQGNLLFSGTLKENLTIIRPDATEEELRQAVYVSGMDEFLPALPMGLDTPIGENGTGLSEGQAQRLAIARAVLGSAPVLLLDECTSALDVRTEETVLERLRELPGRTCIAVTHRPAAMALADWKLEFCEKTISVSRTGT